MKINPKYKIKNIAGEDIVLLEGTNGVNMTKLISLNQSSAWLWKELEGKDFTLESATELLCAQYDVDVETASNDILKWIQILSDNKILL